MVKPVREGRWREAQQHLAAGLVLATTYVVAQREA